MKSAFLDTPKKPIKFGHAIFSSFAESTKKRTKNMSDEENCKIEELIDEPKTETKVDPSKNASPHQNVSAALIKKRKRGKKAYEDEIKGKGNFFLCFV